MRQGYEMSTAGGKPMAVIDFGRAPDGKRDLHPEPRKQALGIPLTAEARPPSLRWNSVFNRTARFEV